MANATTLPLSPTAPKQHPCAAQLNKTNFFIAGEVAGGVTVVILVCYPSYILLLIMFIILLSSDRGRTPDQLPPGFMAAANVTTTDNHKFTAFLAFYSYAHLSPRFLS